MSSCQFTPSAFSFSDGYNILLKRNIAFGIISVAI